MDVKHVSMTTITDKNESKREERSNLLYFSPFEAKKLIGEMFSFGCSKTCIDDHNQIRMRSKFVTMGT